MKISKYKDRWRTTVLTPDGKHKSIYGKTQKEVRLKANQLIKEIENKEWVKKDTTTLKTWCSEWVENYTAHLKPSTKVSYERIIKNHILPYFGTRTLQSIEHKDIQSFVTKLSKTKSPKTVSNIYSALHTILRDAIKNNIIVRNPADSISLPRVKHNEMNVIPEDKISEFLSACYRISPFANMIEFCLLTGLRQSELIGLTFSRFDKDKGTITIDRQQTVTPERNFITPKHDTVREITLSKRCLEIISEQEAKRPYLYEDDYIFFKKNGNHVSQPTLYKQFKRIAKEIGLPELRFHDLRHTYATLALKSGIDIKTLQSNLGHTTASFTLSRYGHSTQDMKRESANRLDNLIGKLVEEN